MHPDRLPPPQTYAEFHERARCLAVLHGLSFTSSGRTERHNSDVKGHEKSWHRWRRGGMAGDLVHDDTSQVSRDRLEAAADDARTLGFDAVVYFKARDKHLHIEPADE